MGPFPLSDDFGMKAALLVLDRSLDLGKSADYVPRSAVTNISQVGVSGLQDVIGAYARNRCWVSKVPTHTFWFHRFMVGVHKHVGGIRRQDEALTVYVLHEVNKTLEARWKSTTDVLVHRRLTEMGTLFCEGFCTGLRGEEMVWIE
jgi:hypothetical protein